MDAHGFIRTRAALGWANNFTFSNPLPWPRQKKYMRYCILYSFNFLNVIDLKITWLKDKSVFSNSAVRSIYCTYSILHYQRYLHFRYVFPSFPLCHQLALVVRYVTTVDFPSPLKKCKRHIRHVRHMMCPHLIAGMSLYFACVCVAPLLRYWLTVLWNAIPHQIRVFCEPTDYKKKLSSEEQKTRAQLKREETSACHIISQTRRKPGLC